jgi:hypothetical protein
MYICRLHLIIHSIETLFRTWMGKANSANYGLRYAGLHCSNYSICNESFLHCPLSSYVPCSVRYAVSVHLEVALSSGRHAGAQIRHLGCYFGISPQPDTHGNKHACTLDLSSPHSIPKIQCKRLKQLPSDIAMPWVRRLYAASDMRVPGFQSLGICNGCNLFSYNFSALLWGGVQTPHCFLP